MWSKKLPFPITALDQHTLLLGKTRSGKSSKMRLIVEYFLNSKTPVTVIDPKGDWWGLKSSASGKEAGYPIIIFGSEWAKFADVRINKHSGAEIGKLVATGNRSCIIDLKGMTVADRTQFFIDFADAYFRHAEGNRVLAIDEVHNFAPQGKVIDPKAGMALHWANRLISEGAGMGITMLSASQRPQKVHKDYATSHETLIACRAVHKLDRDASGDWVDACGDPDVKKELLGSLAEMQRDEAWVYSPEIKFGPRKISFPLFSTYDSFAPQQAKTSKKLKGWAAIDLGEIEEKLSTLVEENKAKDPVALQKKVRDLETQLIAAQKAVGKAVQPVVNQGFTQQEMEAEYLRGHSNGMIDGRIQAAKEISGLYAKAVADFLNTSRAIAAAGNSVDEYIKECESEQKKRAKEKAAKPSATKAPAKPVASSSYTTPPSIKVTPTDANLTNPQKQLLTALAWWAGMGIYEPTRAQLAGKAKWKPKGSNLRNRLTELSSAGLVTYPSKETVALTSAGSAAAPAPDMSAKLIASIKDALTNPQNAVFDAVMNASGPISRAALAEALGWEPGGSNLRNRLTELSSLELVRYPNKESVELQAWVKEHV